MIVPGGGLSPDGARWVACRSNFLVHVNLLARLLSGKMLAMLADAHDAGQLTFFNAHAGLADKTAFKRFIAPLRRIKCRVGGDVAIPTPQSGRIEARTGLRMMPTFPQSPLTFRTAGFPQYG
jgi:Putative transposase